MLQLDLVFLATIWTVFLLTFFRKRTTLGFIIAGCVAYKYGGALFQACFKLFLEVFWRIFTLVNIAAIALMIYKCCDGTPELIDAITFDNFAAIFNVQQRNTVLDESMAREMVLVKKQLEDTLVKLDFKDKQIETKEVQIKKHHAEIAKLAGDYNKVNQNWQSCSAKYQEVIRHNQELSTAKPNIKTIQEIPEHLQQELNKVHNSLLLENTEKVRAECKAQFLSEAILIDKAQSKSDATSKAEIPTANGSNFEGILRSKLRSALQEKKAAEAECAQLRSDVAKLQRARDENQRGFASERTLLEAAVSKKDAIIQSLNTSIEQSSNDLVSLQAECSSLRAQQEEVKNHAEIMYTNLQEKKKEVEREASLQIAQLHNKVQKLSNQQTADDNKAATTKVQDQLDTAMKQLSEARAENARIMSEKVMLDDEFARARQAQSGFVVQKIESDNKFQKRIAELDAKLSAEEEKVFALEFEMQDHHELDAYETILNLIEHTLTGSNGNASFDHDAAVRQLKQAHVSLLSSIELIITGSQGDTSFKHVEAVQKLKEDCDDLITQVRE